MSSSSSEETAPYGSGAPATSAPVEGADHHFREMKKRGERFTVLTLYDMYTARVFDEAGVDALLIGDGDVAARLTKELAIPTIGIGAGNQTERQVLVWRDAFGLNSARRPRFVKQYADPYGVLLEAARSYAAEVKDGSFPGLERTF